jgi:hypothetical protein
MLTELMKFDVINIHYSVLSFYADIFTEPSLYIWTDHTELYIKNEGDILQILYENTNIKITFISNNQRYSYWPAILV